MQANDWPERIERVRKEHNGIFGVQLFMGHDGHNVCRFTDYEKLIAEGQSGVSMQQAVERCLNAWALELAARSFARDPHAR